LRPYKEFLSFKNIMTNSTGKTTFSDLIYRIVLLLTGIIRLRLLINYLGGEKYGLWALLVSIAMWFIIFDFGFGVSLKNKIGEFKEKGEKEEEYKTIISVFGILFFIFLVLFSLILGLCALGIPVKLWGKYGLPSKELNYSFFVISFLILIRLPLNVTKGIYYIHNRGYYYNYFITISNIVSLILIFIFVKLKAQIYVLMTLAFGIEVIFIFLLYIKFMNDRFNTFKILQLNLKHVSNVFSVGIYFFIIGIFSLIAYRIDNVVIERFIDLKSVAIYSVVYKLYSYSVVIPDILFHTLWPKYTLLYYKNEKATLVSILKKQYFLTSIYGLIVAFVMLFGGKSIILIWTARNVIPPQNLLAGFALLVWFNCMNSSSITYLNALSIVRQRSILQILNALVNLVLSVFLVQKIGIMGVLLGTLIPYAIFILGYNMYLTRKNIKEMFVKPVYKGSHSQ